MNGFKDHFSIQATEYARYRPTYPAEFFQYLAGLVVDRELAWDCATGNGQAAIALAVHFERVIATDASAEQIGNTRPSARVTYCVARAEESGLLSSSCDLVTVAQALHWLDLPAFYDEANRVLKPDGVIAVWNYNLLQIEPDVNATVDRFYNEIVGPFWPPERQLIEKGYGELFFPFEECDAPSFQMSTQWSLDSLLGYLRTWSAAHRYRQATGTDAVDVIESDLRRLWPNADEKREVTWPLSVRVGRRSA